MPKIPSISLLEKINATLRENKLSPENKRRLQNILDYIIETRVVIFSLIDTKDKMVESDNIKKYEERKKWAQYHRGNFYLRFYLYDQRIIQFLNCIFLELTPENRSLKHEILNNKKCHGVNNFLDKFYK